MSIRPSVPMSPRAPIDPRDLPKPAEINPIKPADPTVLVNGKPVTSPAEGEKTSASGGTKETAASKVAEQKFSGQAQEAKVNSLWEATKNQSPNVIVNAKPAHRTGDQQTHCDDQNDIKEKK